ncbi:MAG TPA: DUF1559 domain-containing protein, partial [Gemmataceae bacterium]|nr:DUF1559 domain-containing protein [Gemmataceae bacterium]
MAAKIEFKQQCPSCEAQVPIRDRKLIGRKIDCPQCKYRFVVEDPEEAAEETPARRGNADGPAARRPGARTKVGRARPDADDEEADRPRKKKPEGSSRTLLIGLGLGAFALVVLGLVGFLLFGGGNDTTTRPAGPGSGGTEGVEEQPREDNQKPEQPQKAEVGDPTNLLPNDTEAVISANVPRAINTILWRILFDVRDGTPGGFSQEAFAKKFGFGVDDVKRLVLANNDSEGWQFSVIRTGRAIRLDDLKSGLGLKPGPNSPIQGLEYYLVGGDLDALGTFLFKGLPKQLGLYLADDYTLILAHLAPLEKFLQDKGRPKFLTEPPRDIPIPDEGDIPRPGGEQPAPAPDQPPPPPAQPRGVRAEAMQLRPGEGGRGGNQPPGEGQSPRVLASSSYLTINPVLKDLLDRLEAAQEPVVLSAAGLITRKGFTSRPYPSPFNSNVPAALQQFLLKEVAALGYAIEDLKEEKLPYVLTIDYKNEQTATAIEKLNREKGLAEIAKLFRETFGLYTVVLDEQGQVVPEMAPLDMAGMPIPPPEGIPTSKISLTRNEKRLTFRFDLAPTEEVLNRLVQMNQVAVVQMKGRIEMSISRPRLHDLSAALRQYVERHNGEFPRGTIERKPAAERAGLPWRPDERLSWLVELLPFLGLGEFRSLYDRIDMDKSWRDPENAVVAFTLVPYFMAPGTPEAHWWITYPGAPGPVGTTHFVGVAGVGLDVADPEFAGRDPDWQKKIGVFGYDRVTKREDIKDGPQNTIAVLQVPPFFKAPWMAGGGGTVRGVPETDSVRPFVCTEYNGKAGTFAIMADFSVRFIPEDIPEEIFRAMCTINGGEMIEKLDEIAPLVPVEAGRVELKAASP